MAEALRRSNGAAAAASRPHPPDTLPHSLQAEQALLGSLLIDGGAWDKVADAITEADFYRPDHRLIFEAIGALVGANKPCDVVIVSEQLERTAKLEAVGGLAYVSSLARNTPTAANVRAYAGIVRERSLLRQFIDVGSQIQRAATESGSPTEIFAAFAPRIESLRQRACTVVSDVEDKPGRRAPIAWDSLEGREPPPREWIIPHWIPHGHTTLLSGRGGVGKTLIAQHIASALAFGHEYLEPLEPRRVLMWGGEDDEAEFWRRQIQICSWMGKSMSDLTEHFYLHSYEGADITLMEPVFGALKPAPMLAELQQQVHDYRAEVVILDNVARIFGGSENDRHAVTTFCALVQNACAPAAVILLGHPAKAPGSEYSGSTAWEGAVRARLYFGDRPPDEDSSDDDIPIDGQVRYLARRKANYSAAEIRRLRLIDGVLVPAAIDPATSGRPSEHIVRDAVRQVVEKLASRGFHGTASNSSPNYLPKLAKQYKLLDPAVSEKAFADAMRAMILSGELISGQVGKYSNRAPKMGLILPPGCLHK